MLQLAPLAPNAPAAAPGEPILPNRAYAYAFAFPATPLRTCEIIPGKIITVAVADGARAPHDSRNWFSVRTPAVPPVTGPLRVAGVSPGDTIEIDLLALEPDDPEEGSHSSSRFPSRVATATVRYWCSPQSRLVA